MRVEIVDIIAQVVQAAALCQKSAHRRIGRGGFHELDQRVAHVQETDLHFLVRIMRDLAILGGMQPFGKVFNPHGDAAHDKTCMMQAHAWLGAAWGGCNSAHEKQVGAVFLYIISFSIFSSLACLHGRKAWIMKGLDLNYQFVSDLRRAREALR